MKTILIRRPSQLGLVGLPQHVLDSVCKMTYLVVWPPLSHCKTSFEVLCFGAYFTSLRTVLNSFITKWEMGWIGCDLLGKAGGREEENGVNCSTDWFCTETITMFSSDKTPKYTFGMWVCFTYKPSRQWSRSLWFVSHKSVTTIKQTIHPWSVIRGQRYDSPGRQWITNRNF